MTIRNLLRARCLALLVLASLGFAPPARAEAGFEAWRARFEADIQGEGLTSGVVQEALDSATFLPRVIELDQKQPESTVTFARYAERILSPDRIQRGRALYRQHQRLLERIAGEYGVPARYIVALWGIETNYGANTGGTEIISALATLAYEGRRADFFRQELVQALRVLDQGHISVHEMKGSWAGAMGQCQFMPSSFMRFAVDGNGDGRRDIWNSLPDVFASTANYLAQSGWKSGEHWGREVRLPARARPDWVGLDTQRPLSEWARLGVLLRDGSALPARDDLDASLVQPDGPGGRAFLVYDNYRVVMKWNRSTYFATTVGLLADRLGI